MNRHLREKTFDCRRMEETAKCYLPDEATDVEVDRVSDYRLDVRARLPMNFDNSLPRALTWARTIADHYERNGVCLAFDVHVSFGFHASFELA